MPYQPEGDGYQGSKPYYNESNNSYGGDSNKSFQLRPPFQTRPFNSYQSNINQSQ